MPRPKQPIEPTYGKLTVLRELPCSTVEVQCECGTTKVVGRSNLRSGRILSCGARLCRTPAVGASVGALHGPQWLTREQIPEVWEKYSVAGICAADLADEYGSRTQTVYSLMAKINHTGGIDAYMAALRGEATSAPQVTDPVTPAVAGVVKPPLTYVPPKRIVGDPLPGVTLPATPMA